MSAGLPKPLFSANDQAAVLQFPEDPRGTLAAAVELCLHLLQGEVQPDRAVRLDVAVLPGNAGSVQQKCIGCCIDFFLSAPRPH